ncbi:tyrosine phosphatase family-domain-containing protein [Melampsora americana]|nr:tyrosine phosphatase family-domain-containing protein [Melampsora americana]
MILDSSLIINSSSSSTSSSSEVEIDQFFQTYLPHPISDHSSRHSLSSHHKSTSPIIHHHPSLLNLSNQSISQASDQTPSTTSTFDSILISDSNETSNSSSSSSEYSTSNTSSLILSSSSNSPIITTLPIEPAPPPTSHHQFILPGPALVSSKCFNSSLAEIIYHPPPNFGLVAPGIYRSSFPNHLHFEFLKTLGLKSVLTLVQEKYSPECLNFYHQEGIKFMQFSIPGNKEPFVHIPEEKVRLALKHVLDVRNHPMLIHCNKGKHRTGCLVGCLRKLQHWSSTSIFDEYRRYAFPKSRNMDQQFIELFDLAPVWDEIDPDFAPDWLDLST